MALFRPLLLLLVLPGFLLAQPKSQTPEEYIAKYAPIAVREMKRVGIPASITLAQGLLESGNGNSVLAVQANNHFGIKCKKDWTGPTINVDDDAKGECFRAYPNAEASYDDHSDFLKNGSRYASLFSLDPKDYRGWAKGLKEAGYATNPKYPELLIGLIERYKLNQYDDGKVPDLPKPDKDKPKDDPGPIVSQPLPPSPAAVLHGVPIHTVKNPMETFETIARAHQMMPWQIWKYNDLEKTDALPLGEVLYLKPKRGKPKNKTYKVKPGDDMRWISQNEFIKLSKLQKLNRMAPGTEPKPGEILQLRSRADSAPALTINPPKTRKSFRGGVPDPFISPQTKPDDAAHVRPNLNNPSYRPDTGAIRYHTVTAGQTLAAIAKMYEATAEEIMELNNLASDQLRTGQVLIVGKGVAVEKYHTVNAGQTLYAIAKAYGTTVEAIQQLNGMTGTYLRVGQQLRVR